MLCRRLYLADKRCTHQQSAESEFCRWHQIIDMEKRRARESGGRVRYWILGVPLIFLPDIIVFNQTGSADTASVEVFTVVLSIWLGGLLLVMFGKGLIRPWYLPAELPACAKLMASGYALMALAGLVVTVGFIPATGRGSGLHSWGDYLLSPGLGSVMSITFAYSSVWLSRYVFRKGSALNYLGPGSILLAALYVAWSVIAVLITVAR